MMISTERGKQCGFGDFEVIVISNYFVALKDGTRLAIKVWLPDNDLAQHFNGTVQKQLYGPPNPSQEKSYPVILEYLPYRKDDYTAPRDYQRHTWFCSNGYVIVRCDFRGTGDSDGMYYGEYLAQEQKDACELISWLDQQSWCNGKVGMYGKSWGGFNGLQLAYEQPPALKAVISLYSTDDRYLMDIHYDNGCMIGHGMLSWACYMFAFNGRCPDPRHRPDDWKEVWKERLEKSSFPWAKDWLAHQSRDEFWMHGSICKAPDKLKCPTLLIGGYRDGYTDAVFRMINSVPGSKGIVGPWAHEWPDVSKPGPNIDYLRTCLDWWDCHLKGHDTPAIQQPNLLWYIKDAERPSKKCEYSPGRWISVNEWPPKSDAHSTTTFALAPNENLSSVKSLNEQWTTIPYSTACGIAGPAAWLSFGAADNADDQSPDDNLSACWTTQPLDADFTVAGFPHLRCQVEVDTSGGGQLIVRLCDVWPDGKSNLITYGVINLTHRNGWDPDKVRNVEAGEIFNLDLELHVTGYTLPKGHQLRVALSSGWWPHVWTAPQKNAMRMKEGELVLPQYTGQESLNDINCSNPALGPEIPHTIVGDPASFSIENEHSRDGHTRTVRCNFGDVMLNEEQVIMNQKYEEKYMINDHDPTSARAEIKHNVKFEWPQVDEGVKTEVDTFSVLTCDLQSFYLTSILKVYLNDKEFYQKKWSDKIKREWV